MTTDDGRLPEQRLLEVAETLRVERDRLSTYLHIAGVIVVVIRSDQTVELINRKGCEILGHEAHEIIGKNWFLNFLPPAIAPQVQAAFEQLIAGNLEPIEHYQNPVMARDGTERLVEWHNALLFDVEGAITHSISSGSDITDRVRAEQAQRATESRYRHIVESCIQGVWTIDAQAKTTFVNDRLIAMLGYTREEMLGVPLADFCNEPVENNLKRREAGISEEHTFCLRHKSGRDVYTIMATNPLLAEDGTYIGALALVNDVTEQRRQDKEREQLRAKMLEAQKLESLGTLAGGIAHDFNNLLVGILGNAELLELSGAFVPDSLAALKDIHHAATRAAGLARQLLQYSGGGQLVVQNIDPVEHMESIIRLLRSTISKNVRQKFEPEISGLTVQVDPDQFQQVIMNLVINAAESYGQKGGDVLIRCRDVELDADQPMDASHVIGGVGAGLHVHIEVEDRGCGMSAGDLAKIFDPFFTTKFTGRGLGLAAARGIIQRHAACLTVDSEIDRGTRFGLYLRAAKATAEAPTEATAPLRDGASARVLVVDDELLTRSFLERALRQSGYEVVLVNSGDRAIAQVQRDPSIAFVVLDVVMPDTDGAAVFEALRRVRPQLPVLVHSGYLETDAASKFHLSGPVAFIQKPCSASALIRRLQTLES